MAPRGLSAEEKRVRLLEIFHETKDFFQLKELEKLGPKMKGIVTQSIKEVLQTLVDDGHVQTDKIGSSNFFWSFPSRQGTLMKAELVAVNDARKIYRTQLTELQATIEGEISARIVTVERAASLEKLTSHKKELEALEKELAAYGDCDPAMFTQTKRAGLLAKEAAVRWTDNYAALVGYFTREKGVDASEVRGYLGIEEDYEEIC
ncbi:meiotic nuclear division protein 1 [Amanita rubescens]|nr:meiotic nuclear division protein 1 [Amanita rubescens]